MKKNIKRILTLAVIVLAVLFTVNNYNYLMEKNFEFKNELLNAFLTPMFVAVLETLALLILFALVLAIFTKSNIESLSIGNGLFEIKMSQKQRSELIKAGNEPIRALQFLGAMKETKSAYVARMVVDETPLNATILVFEEVKKFYKETYNAEVNFTVAEHSGSLDTEMGRLVNQSIQTSDVVVNSLDNRKLAYSLENNGVRYDVTAISDAREFKDYDEELIKQAADTVLIEWFETSILFSLVD